VTSVPRNPFSDDDGDWRELEAALTVAHAALTDARALTERLEPDAAQRSKTLRGLRLTDALAMCLTILDAYLDPTDPAEDER